MNHRVAQHLLAEKIMARSSRRDLNLIKSSKRLPQIRRPSITDKRPSLENSFRFTDAWKTSSNLSMCASGAKSPLPSEKELNVNRAAITPVRQQFVQEIKK